MRKFEIPEIRIINLEEEWDEEFWDDFVKGYSKTLRKQKRMEKVRSSIPQGSWSARSSGACFLEPDYSKSLEPS